MERYKLYAFAPVVTFNNGNASQSTTYPGIMYDARYAVDKDVTTCARTEVIGTTSADKSVWWRMDLGEMSIVQRVDISFKNYDGFGKYALKRIYTVRQYFLISLYMYMLFDKSVAFKMHRYKKLWIKQKYVIKYLYPNVNQSCWQFVICLKFALFYKIL